MEIPIEGWKIRSWHTGDAAALLKYANNPRVWINLRDSFPYPYTEADARAWLAAAVLQIPETAFAIASPDEVIGGISIQPQYDVYRKSAEIGYWLGEPFWGKGIATLAVRALTAHAFTRLDLVRLYASVFAWNPASARVLEKAGYHLEGKMREAVYKNGKVTDQLLYGMTKTDFLTRR
jgi:[ribosomal protein S5]-alanine N-acetyltransferase